METDLEIIIAGFNNTAARLYEAAFNQLIVSLKGTNRSKNENVFKMQEAKCRFMLRNQLEQLANETLQKNQNKPLHHLLNLQLSASINYYLQEFRHKSNAL